MTTMLPRDADNTPIPALRLKPGGAQVIAVGNVTARNAVAFSADTRVIGIYATGPVFLRTGGGSVTASATDHFIPADTYIDLSLGGEKQSRHTHVAAIRAASDCTLYLSEKE